MYALKKPKWQIQKETKVSFILFFFFRRHGPVRYRFQGLYELDSLAVVNVRDAGPIKNAFKILMFPETRMYQADSAKSKVCLHDKIAQKTKKPTPHYPHSKKKQQKNLSVILSFITYSLDCQKHFYRKHVGQVLSLRQ
jgi:hypothetical protein